MGIMRTLTINGIKYDLVPVVPADSVTLLASAWVGDGDAYSQVVTVPGVTACTKVDLQPTSAQLTEFHYKVLAFVAENDGGKVTVYSIGDKPSNDHIIQITKTEVEATGKIRGNTVGTTMPRANLEQTDPRKADYVLGKETFLESAVNDALTKAKASGEFDGERGHSIFSVSDSGDFDEAGYGVFNKADVSADTEIKPGDFLITSVDNRLCYVLSVGDPNVICKDWGILNGVSISKITIEELQIISFTIDGISYQAEEEMTWAEWVDSSFNTGGFEVNGSDITNTGGQDWVIWTAYGEDEAVSKNRVIIADYAYRTGIAF